MRRGCTNRLFQLLVFGLVVYTIWFFAGDSDPTRDVAESRAYQKAIKASSPIIHNTHLCSPDETDLVIVIISSTSHFLERQSIRETWGSIQDLHGVQSRRLFVIGYQKDSGFFREVSNEAQHEQDLLFLTVDESSMTLKELRAYEWLDQYCPNITFTFKTEDDLFLNTYLLHALVGELNTEPDRFQNRFLYNSSLDNLFLAHINPDAHTFMFGWAFQPGKPERNATMGPYYVSYKEYSKDLYPRYCSGFGYLMDTKTRQVITTEAAKDKEPFRFSDIYISGMVPERMNFICDLLPFSYNQGTAEQCINLIKKNNNKNSDGSSPPLIVCSTGRHVAQNTFSDYYRIWTVLKYVYGETTTKTPKKDVEE